MRRLEAEDLDVPDNELIELVIRDVGLEYISKRSIHMQKLLYEETKNFTYGSYYFGLEIFSLG
jgi:hypothetical protein